VSSKNRPINSLLEEDLEIDYGARPVPLMTPEVTETLEDRLKRRILDEAWDDVERKVVVESDKDYQPREITDLDFEKNKKGLGELYEQDYLEKTQKPSFSSSSEEALKIRHEEIERVFRTICVKLDALSNAHFVPKPPTKDELMIIPNVDAIAMEEAIPSSVSHATLLAPEEIYAKKKKPLRSASELTSEERHRQRLNKKRKRQTVSRQKLHHHGTRLSREKALKELKAAGPKQVTLAQNKTKTTHRIKATIRNQPKPFLNKNS
jgi:U3 small nucleolar RNA-associated protein MPP10